MPYDDFRHVDTWVFDLDNTLYPPEVRLFDQIERLMTGFIVREIGVDIAAAHDLRRHYWKTYGTTLAGLMHEHGVAPDPFLHEVHALDLGNMPAAPELRRAIAALPGRKIIYTNGSRAHGEKVSAARGLAGVFDAIYGIEDAGYVPKPDRGAFERVFGADGFETGRAAMFEDDPRNLAVPRKMGMRTVLVGAANKGEHIDHRTGDLSEFLQKLV